MDFISDNLALSDDNAQNWSDNNSDEPLPSPVISRRGSVSSTSSRASEPPDDSDDDYATTDGTNDGSMTLPPEECFSSFDALEQSANLHARQHGYAVSGIRSKPRYKTKSTCRKIYMGCQCSTKYRDRTKKARRRERHTLKTDCQFSFMALQNEDGSWDLKHRPGVKYRGHNHGPSNTPAVHYQHRKLRGEALRQAKALISAGLEPKDIVTILSQTTDVPPIAQDIINLAQKLQVIELNGNTSIDALNETMDAQGWIHEHKIDESGHLTHLFMASKESLEYAKKHPDILIIDCTYKTNRFEMPLLDIIGIYLPLFTLECITNFV
jgi:hypothetical protein